MNDNDFDPDKDPVIERIEKEQEAEFRREEEEIERVEEKAREAQRKFEEGSRWPQQ